MKSVVQARRPVMEIGIGSLGEGDLPFDFDVRSVDLDLPPETFSDDLHVEGVLRKVQAQLTLSASVATRWHRTCDRCLFADDVDLVVPFTIYYHEEPEGKDERAETDEFRVLQTGQESIVLDNEVRSVLLVSLPLKQLCRDDCKGLCPVCGADLNREPCGCSAQEIDPRWEKLSTLFKAGGETSGS